MLRWLAVLALAITLGLGLAVTTTGCAGPYSGKPERLKKPKKKKPPEPEEGEAAKEPEFVEDCRTNFFEEPTTRRRSSQGRDLSKQAERYLYDADEQEGAERIQLVADAMGKLRNALKADPYGPEPTYKMAVAYAMVGQKGCALRLLERLQELTKMPEVEPEAERTIKRALHDQAFEPFRKDADTALGQ